MDNIIEARGLVKSYGEKTAVNNLNFEVKKGEFFGIIGPNAAGKSSLMKMMYCSSQLSSGELYVLGLNAKTDASEIKLRIGVVPQDDGLDPDFSVLDNLLVFARYFSIPKSKAKARAQELLRLMKLEEYENHRCEDLSGGMRRRLSIARALLNRPDILFLDEPTTALDPQSRLWVWESFEALRKDNISIVLTTHYMEEAEEVCDRIMIMDKGKKIGDGIPKALISDYVGLEVVEFEVSPSDINYYIKKIEGHFEYQVLNRSLRLFIKPHQDSRKAMDLFSSDNIIVRKACLDDVFLKIAGYDLGQNFGDKLRGDF